MVTCLQDETRAINISKYDKNLHKNQMDQTGRYNDGKVLQHRGHEQTLFHVDLH